MSITTHWDSCERSLSLPGRFQACAARAGCSLRFAAFFHGFNLHAQKTQALRDYTRCGCKNVKQKGRKFRSRWRNCHTTSGSEHSLAGAPPMSESRKIHPITIVFTLFFNLSLTVIHIELSRRRTKPRGTSQFRCAAVGRCGLTELVATRAHNFGVLFFQSQQELSTGLRVCRFPHVAK